MNKSRIGILTGGGDCAGLNPAIKWAVKTALDRRLTQECGTEFEVIGIRNGWQGLITVDPSKMENGKYTVTLNEAMVRTWDRLGGTYLGSSRTNPYNPENDCSRLVMDNIAKLGLEALICIGGEDTLGVAYKLGQAGVNVVGIPKTIDKDLSGTEYTLGFETALNVITNAVDSLRTTAGSHERIFVIETMGRHAGWLALEGGESSGAFIILIPECDFSMNKVNDLVLEGRSLGARYDIILVAEGAKPVGGTEILKDEAPDSFGHKYLGGIGEYVARGIRKGTGLETRSLTLGHLQRGGDPCAYDRRMGRYFGIAAVDLVVARDYGKMVSMKNGEITTVPIKEALKPSLVNIKTQYDTERYSGRRAILRVRRKIRGQC
ncbi:MAG: ATP-dependent 6-phosphofructokinase [Dehalococcoidales bacterium]|nr:ATP-dependent 6-phosphofructokinase [Dehalococcoidales bacterium]